MFKETGQINVYMFYKALEKSYLEENQDDTALADSIAVSNSDISAGMDA